MKETELRIGNLVEFEDEIYTVSGIGQMFNDEPYNIQLKDINGMFVDAPVEDVEPIKLNTDLLLLLGFNENLGEYSVDLKFGKFTVNPKRDWIYCIMQAEGVSRIYYTHSLQNIYYALTGKELLTNNKVYRLQS